MSQSSRGLARTANKRGAISCAPTCKPLHQILPFEQFLRAVWPTDAAKSFGRITGKSIRAIRYKLAGDFKPTYSDVVLLLRSEHGFSFLQHVMGGADPAWWRGISKTRSLATMRKEHDAMRRRIEQLELHLD